MRSARSMGAFIARRIVIPRRSAASENAMNERSAEKGDANGSALSVGEQCIPQSRNDGRENESEAAEKNCSSRGWPLPRSNRFRAATASRQNEGSAHGAESYENNENRIYHAFERLHHDRTIAAPVRRLKPRCFPYIIMTSFLFLPFLSRLVFARSRSALFFFCT